MILLNNAANRRLVNQMRDVVESETGFRASIDKTWNCRKDIRFEIGVVGIVGMDSPFITITDYDIHGHFDMHIRMLTEKVDADNLWILERRIHSVCKLQNQLGELLAAAKPAPSYYAKEATA